MTDSSAPLSILRERVEQDERELESAVRTLASVTRRSVTPAHWIRERPLASLTGALFFGWWLGRSSANRSNTRGGRDDD